MNNTNLTGSYAAGVTQQNNQLAQDTSRGVGTTLQTLNNRGMGATPAGFAADQIRKGYADAATTRGQNFAGALQSQHNEAVGQYNSANQMLAQNTNQNQASATANNSGAAGTNTGLYGTASQQVQSGWGTVLGAAAGLGGAAITKYCWIAEAIYGVDDPRTHAVRAYLCGPFRRHMLGRAVMAVYRVTGQRIAAWIRKVPMLGMALKPLFDVALRAATA